ncbi:MAG: hypothetical protein Q4C53_06540, partial [Clostridia bacterium]|nr:hypothetical protein [Clostridia bacterium]
MLRDPNAAVPMRSAYNAYHLWCRESGYAAENKTNFIAELRNRGLVTNKCIRVHGKPMHNALVGYSLLDG